MMMQKNRKHECVISDNQQTMSETPSAAELRARVSAVLETANLDELTVKKLVGQLSTEFGNDLSARMCFVNEIESFFFCVIFFFFFFFFFSKNR
jgi:hypothetical protein